MVGRLAGLLVVVTLVACAAGWAVCGGRCLDGLSGEGARTGTGEA